LSGIEAVSLGRGEQEQRVACNGESGDEFDGKCGANLGLPNTDELLFVAMVDLDVPAPEVVLNDGLKRQSGIGADQIGGLAIKKAALGGEAIPKRPDDDEAQQPVGAGFAPLCPASTRTAGSRQLETAGSVSGVYR
jgi:hypothetical protein